MPDTPLIVPRPARLEMRRDSAPFQLTDRSRIYCTGGQAGDVAQLLAEYLRPATGFDLPVESESASAEPGCIHLNQTGSPQPDDAGFLPERYTLQITDAIRIEAQAAAGLARGIQTLRQLFDPAIFAIKPQNADWRIDAMHIDDQPRFRWRGLMLDVSRYFFTTAQVCRFIELLALHRYNVCHLHLTDDQGWRVEIRKYPRLTEVGSVRRCTAIGHGAKRPRQYDDKPHRGFYTQQDLRDIVAFAQRRHVNLVPEIDMPGHVQAAIAAYPQLGNTDMTIEPRCHWGISPHVLNVEESTITFMQDVLDEVIDLFPGRFIHVGGDEARKQEWSESHAAQRRMAQLGLNSEDQLQSWFIGRMNQHVRSHGRRLIGWDEILEGGLVEDATVMSWRGEKGGLAAANLGHDVVMAPNEWVYFDYYQAHPTHEEPLAIGGMLPTDRVYAYEPIPAELTHEHHRHVLGAQAQLWTEYIDTEPLLDYMTWPRACALAETLWLQPDQKRYRDFLPRLHHHRRRLTNLNVNAHPRP